MKHMTAAWQDEKVARLTDEGGIEAYGFYWRMLEIVAANMTETSKPVCQLPAKSWARLCNLLSNRFERLSNLLAKCGLCRLETFEGLLKVEFPNLVKYRDEYSKKKPKGGAKTPDNIPSDSGQCPEQEQRQNQSQKQKKKQMENEAGDSGKAETTRRSYPADAEWIAALKTNEAYLHINFDVELGKMAAWLQTPKGRNRQMTRQFILNWINKIDRPVDTGRSEPTYQCDSDRIFAEEMRKHGVMP